MTDSDKTTISRPKVRFSQSAESAPSSDATRVFSKPKIRSIIDLKGPSVTILKAPTGDFGKNCDFEETELQQSSGDAPSNLCHCPGISTSHSVPCLAENILTSESRALKSRNFVGTTKPTTKTLATAVKSQPFLKKSDGTKKLIARVDIPHRDSSSEVRKSCSSLPNNSKKRPEKSLPSVSQTRLATTRVGKENISLLRETKENPLRVPENISKTRSGPESQRPTTCSSKTAQTNTRKSRKDLDAQNASKLRTNPNHTSMKEIGLMPCLKIAKDRRKRSPIKKTILRDVSSGRSSINIGPGLPRPRSLQREVSVNTKIPRSRSEIHSGDKLARPEYNSIVGTIKKLQDLREEKVITDLKHLPTIYRGLVNEKVSSALDFGANEAIYRDLVDLSIDERQLPSRLTRSKDPEPRQKDLVPKLSDFFLPRNDEEYRKAVLPNLPISRVLDIWNPYKISDRIFAWKENLDHNL